MKNKNIFAFAFFAIFLMKQGASAEELPTAEEKNQVGILRIISENDFTLYDPFSGTDRHYTAGNGLAWFTRPKWSYEAAESLPFFDIGGETPSAVKGGVGLTVTQLIFTPSSTLRPVTAPVADDLRYAGYLYAGGIWQRESSFATMPGLRILDSAELNLGVIGPLARSEQTQNGVHSFFGYAHFDGWDNQLRNEPTVQVFLRRKWAMNETFWGFQKSDAWGWELIPEATLAAGNVYDYGELGATFRAGWNLPSDFGAPTLADRGSASAIQDGFSFYVYARVAERIIGYNRFINDSFIVPNGIAGSSLRINPYVFDGSFGVGVSEKISSHFSMELSWGVHLISEQWKGQLDHHDSYGSYRLSLVWKF